MARVDPGDLADKEIARIYIAGRLAEAKRVEKTLSDRGIDYSVELEEYETYVLGLFPTRHAGVAFYVVSSQAESCRRALLEQGLHVGIVDDHQA